jgi:hypothetical protein
MSAVVHLAMPVAGLAAGLPFFAGLRGWCLQLLSPARHSWPHLIAWHLLRIVALGALLAGVAQLGAPSLLEFAGGLLLARTWMMRQAGLVNRA